MSTVSATAWPRLPIQQQALLPDRGLNWPICWAGVEFIGGRFEKCRLRAYKPLPTDPWTCGWGETQGVTANTVWTQAYADQRFCDSLTVYAAKVREALTVEPNEHEFAAMVSLAYNIGLGWNPARPKPAGAKEGFRQSTVLRLHNRGDREGAARAFSLWNKSGGRVVSGLVARRLAEAALYLTPPADADHAPMAQSVEPESKLSGSPLAKAGATTAATGVASIFGVIADQVSALKGPLDSVKDFVVNTIGIPTHAVVPVLLLVAGGAVMYWRWRQRREGWA